MLLPANWQPTGGGPAGLGAPIPSTSYFYYSGLNQNILENYVNSIPAKGVATVVATTPQAGTYNQPGGAGVGVGATFTYAATGPTVIDGYTLGTLMGAADTVLLVAQANQAQNGLYQATTPGSGGTATILTRVASMNSAPDFPGATVSVTGAGTTYGGTQWTCLATGSPVMGTTALPFDGFSPNSSVLVNSSSPASFTLNPQMFQCYKFTSLANLLALDITGSPPDRYPFEVLFTDNGMPQPLVWTPKFKPMGVIGAMPNVTPAGKRMSCKFIWDADQPGGPFAMLAAIDGVGY
jgi:hypothetical protein